MPEELVISGEATTSLEIPRSGDSKRLRWFELSLVLVIAFGASTAQSINILIKGVTAQGSTLDQRWLTSLIYEIGCLALLGYVLWRRGRRITDLGLRWSVRDLLSGILVWGVGYAALHVSYYFVFRIHHALFGAATSGITARQMAGHPSFMIAPFILLNPFFEELIVRAYLMTEIKELTGSSKLAVALSVIVQSAYHLYYGWVAAISLGFYFLVLSIYYARTQKATPIIVAHAIDDILPMLRLM
jgi:membrane protease YdiL (CAAX protease family)